MDARNLHVWLVVFLCAACSSTGGQTDAGSDTAGGDPGPADPGPRPDHDPDESILLTVPAGVHLCTGFAENRTWQEALAMLGRIELRPGHYVLPRQAGFSTGEIVERVLFGPDARVLPASAAGEMEAVYEEWGPSWTFHFRRPFDLAGETYRAEVRVHIRADQDQFPAELTLEPSDWNDPFSARNSVYGEGIIGSGDDWTTGRQPFGLCRLSETQRREHTAQAADGDVATLDVRWCLNGYYAGETGCYALYAASLTLSGETRDVSDSLGLVYAATHHNWEEKFLVILDAPVGDTAAVLVEGPNGFPPVDATMRYLNASLEELRSQPITEWQ